VTLILGIDTATSAIAAALHDGVDVVADDARVDPRGHTEHLAPLVERVLASAGVRPGDLTDIAVGTGPGPFTGLRVGLVTAVTMGHALGVPVHGVCSLDALAENASWLMEGELLVATDARRKEVYWATYAATDSTARRLTDPAVARPAELAADLRSLPTVGRGPELYPGLFPDPVGPLDVDAGALVRLAARRMAAGEPMPVEPLYLRRPDALTTAERAAR